MVYHIGIVVLYYSTYLKQSLLKTKRNKRTLMKKKMNEKGHLYLFYSFNGLFNELCSLHNDTLHCDKMKIFSINFFRTKFNGKEIS